MIKGFSVTQVLNSFGITPSTGALTLSGQSLTGSSASSVIDLATTWNTTGSPSAIKVNVTDTSSGASANLLNLQVGGVSRFSVSKAGNLTLSGNITTSGGVTMAAAGYLVWPGRASFDAAAADIVRLSGSSAGATLQMSEMTAPTAPPTNSVRIYAEDNGSGKTRLMALFASGAAQQIAIEP